MKLTVYCIRDDEAGLLRTKAEELGVELELTPRRLTEETARAARGSDAVAIVTSCRVDDPTAAALQDAGVKYVLTRGTGFDHIDLAAAARHGLRCANVPVYSRSAVSEYAVMAVLALLRRFKDELRKVDRYDFELPRTPARELEALTVGVFGTGRIGSRTARLLHAFGCRVLAYTPHPRAELAGIVEYVSAEDLFRSADVIVFHCALTDATRGIVSRSTLAQMKDGVYLVNAARGELMDFAAVLDALKSGKVAGLATDVYPNEASFVRKNMAGSELDRLLTELVGMDNVIVTPHIAFYTDTAVEGIVTQTLANLMSFADTGACPNELK